MCDEIIVTAENVSKKFCRSLKKSLWYGVQDIAAELMCKRNNLNELRQDEFWALNDVSFQLKKGECLGLIGPNGAGKSTLLKILVGLIKPDKGKVIMDGRVGALIELGAGFNPILTGLENIYVNAAVLGISKSEVKKKIDAIIDFADIPEFINMPLQSYSSGMKVRLGFAIAVQMEPDILIIDEVLAVGDVGFKMKCFNAIRKIAQNAAVILVSHSMIQVSRIASRILVLNKGQLFFSGENVNEGISNYQKLFGEREMVRAAGQEVSLKTTALYSKITDKQERIPVIKYRDELTIELGFTLDKSVSRYRVNIAFFDNSQANVAETNSLFATGEYFKNTHDQQHIIIKIPSVHLANGLYSLSVVFTGVSSSSDWGKVLGLYNNVKEFEASGCYIMSTAPIQLPGKWIISQ